MSKRMFLCVGLVIAGLGFVAGCGNDGGKAANAPAQPKWKGQPYRLAFDTKAAAAKQTPGVINLPAIKYTANPEALETRALLVMRFSGPAKAGEDPVMHRMIGSPVDIKGEEGTLPADYMDRASKGLAEYLGAYCIQGKVNLSVALARSSLNPQGGDGEVDAKRLSDWLPTVVDYKNAPHSKCK